MIAMGFKSGLIIGISLIITVFRFFPVPLFGGRNDATRIIGCFCTGNGHVGNNAIVIIDGILVDLKAGKTDGKP